MIHGVDAIPKNAVGHNFRQKIAMSSAPAELNCNGFPRLLAWGSLLLISLETVYVDGQLGREPGRYQVPSLGKLENVSKWGFSSGFGWKGTCVNPL